MVENRLRHSAQLLAGVAEIGQCPLVDADVQYISVWEVVGMFAVEAKAGENEEEKLVAKILEPHCRAGRTKKRSWTQSKFLDVGSII